MNDPIVSENDEVFKPGQNSIPYTKGGVTIYLEIARVEPECRPDRLEERELVFRSANGTKVIPAKPVAKSPEMK